MVIVFLLGFFPLLEVDASFVQGVVEKLLEAIFVDLLFSAVLAVVEALTSFVGESFLGIILTLILVGTAGMAVVRASES